MSTPTLLALLRENKIEITPSFNTGFHRNGSQWFTGYEQRDGELVRRIAFFGDFARSKSLSWEDAGASILSPEQQAKFDEFKKASANENQKAREEFWAKVQVEVEKEWATFSDLGISPYFEKKKLAGLYGCRLEAHERGARTIVPARDSSGKLWGYQTIYSEKLDIGDKAFRKGARKEGCFHLLGTINPATPLYIAEGIATAISIYEAFEKQVAVASCFDAGNLAHVARSLRKLYPATPFVFCADNDQWPARDGKVYHTGRVKAETAAKEVGNATVVLAEFTPEQMSSKPTDFDDVRLLAGLSEVKRQISEPASTAPAERPKVTETLLAELVLKQFEGSLIRQDKSLFQYNGTHWKELETWDIDQIKNRFNAICKNSLDSKKVNSIYATFFRLVDHVPVGVNLFVPNPKCGNFLDGTLRLNRDSKTGIYCLSFSKHRKEDYLTWVIPVNYNCDRTLRNKKLDALIDDALRGEPDAKGMLRALKQMGGAMLVPTFPQMFFLYGVSGSRKSTIALSLAKLLAEQNVSAVDPANMENFQLEGMIGKLVNMHTDIDDHVALPRGFLKRFEDDTPVQVNRKGKPVVRSRLPSVHVYCANNLPPNFEGEGKAFQRRLTLLKFKNDLTHGVHADGVVKRFEELVWAEGYEGILNFCLEGLIDLVNSGGKFFTPASSLEELREWQLSHDPLGQFLEALAHKEVDQGNQYLLDPEAQIERKNLWESFAAWQSNAYGPRAPWNQKTLCSAMRKHGFGEKMIKGVRYWVGIGLIASDKSAV